MQSSGGLRPGAFFICTPFSLSISCPSFLRHTVPGKFCRSCFLWYNLVHAGSIDAETTHYGGDAVIAGLGIDLCSISRMRKAIQSEHFQKRVFHDSEIGYALSKADPAKHFAGSFAAREAFSKASSLSMYSLAFQGAWVERTGTGPVLKLSETVRSMLPGEKSGRVLLSISHDGDYAVAVVIIEATE